MTVPAFTPVSTPVVAWMVAIALLLLLHVPPAVASLSMVVAPLQIDVVPVIASGSGCTVIGVFVSQPAAVT
jgi:hypothetical protein